MDKMIVYEDDFLLVVHKPVGIATETARIGQADLVSELKNYRKKKGEDTYVGVVHRLDQPVEGLLVFAKDGETANKLSDELQNGTLTKRYVVLTSGVPQTSEGELTDYLLKDGRTNLSRVVPEGEKGAKKAALFWKLLQHDGAVSLLEIELYTGRHHQIRVQMSHAGMSLLGDYKYADAQIVRISEQMRVKEVALCACQLSFRHPRTGKRMDFKIRPEGKIFQTEEFEPYYP